MIVFIFVLYYLFKISSSIVAPPLSETYTLQTGGTGCSPQSEMLKCSGINRATTFSFTCDLMLYRGGQRQVDASRIFTYEINTLTVPSQCTGEGFDGQSTIYPCVCRDLQRLHQVDLIGIEFTIGIFSFPIRPELLGDTKTLALCIFPWTGNQCAINRLDTLCNGRGTVEGFNLRLGGDASVFVTFGAGTFCYYDYQFFDPTATGIDINLDGVCEFDHCVCEPPWGGVHCETPCYGIDSSKGYCVEGSTTPTCINGYVSSVNGHCDVPCYGIDPDIGTCLKADGTVDLDNNGKVRFTCSSFLYFGDKCQFVCSEWCGGHLHCFQLWGCYLPICFCNGRGDLVNGKCLCEAAYGGTLCEYDLSNSGSCHLSILNAAILPLPIDSIAPTCRAITGTDGNLIGYALECCDSNGALCRPVEPGSFCTF
jgi:hypothetical protein